MTKALIIEDDKAIALLLENLIKPLVDEIHVCYTMEEALGYIKQHNNPDIVTLDLNLPDSRWKQSLERIKDLKADNTVLFVVTGIVEESDLVGNSLASGADSVIQKDETLFQKGGLLRNIRDTFRSLMRNPVRYKAHSQILQSISRILDKKP
jgi:CheY-like chemotaxis protein